MDAIGTAIDELQPPITWGSSIHKVYNSLPQAGVPNTIYSPPTQANCTVYTN